MTKKRRAIYWGMGQIPMKYTMTITPPRLYGVVGGSFRIKHGVGL